MVDPDDGADYVDLTPYKAARREEDEEPRLPGFRLYGEVYVCASPLLRASTLYDLQVRSREFSRTEGMHGFLKDVLDADSWTRFEKAFRDPRLDFGIDVLDECVGQVIREFTGRPTQESPSSQASPSGPGQSGKRGSAKKRAAR